MPQPNPTYAQTELVQVLPQENTQNVEELPQQHANKIEQALTEPNAQMDQKKLELNPVENVDGNVGLYEAPVDGTRLSEHVH